MTRRKTDKASKVAARITRRTTDKAQRIASRMTRLKSGESLRAVGRRTRHTTDEASRAAARMIRRKTDKAPSVTDRITRSNIDEAPRTTDRMIRRKTDSASSAAARMTRRKTDKTPRATARNTRRKTDKTPSATVRMTRRKSDGVPRTSARMTRRKADEALRTAARNTRRKTDKTPSATARMTRRKSDGVPRTSARMTRREADEALRTAARNTRCKIDKAPRAAALMTKHKTREAARSHVRYCTDTKGNSMRNSAERCPNPEYASASLSSKPVSVVDPSQMKALHVASINARSDSDKLIVWISGSAVVSADRLLFSDNFNDKVKLVDTHSQRILSELQLPSQPWDVTVINTNQAAVTLPYSKMILLLEIADTMTLLKEIGVRGNCFGVAYSQDRLLVTFTDNPRVEIIDLHGNVIRRIELNHDAGDGSKLFKCPVYVCVCRDGETIYISDRTRSTVTRLTLDGAVKSVYKDLELRGARKVCTDHHGNVYVCGHYSDNVHMITEDCRKIKVLLSKADGQYSGVWSASHCQGTNRLFIGMCRYSIEAFQLS